MKKLTKKICVSEKEIERLLKKCDGKVEKHYVTAGQVDIIISNTFNAQLLNFSKSTDQVLRFNQNEICSYLFKKLKPKYLFFKNLTEKMFQKDDFCFYQSSDQTKFSHLGKIFGIPKFNKGNFNV